MHFFTKRKNKQTKQNKKINKQTTKKKQKKKTKKKQRKEKLFYPKSQNAQHLQTCIIQICILHNFSV